MKTLLRIRSRASYNNDLFDDLSDHKFCGQKSVWHNIILVSGKSIVSNRKTFRSLTIFKRSLLLPVVKSCYAYRAKDLGGGRRPSLFPPRMWNVNERVLNDVVSSLAN